MNYCARCGHALTRQVPPGEDRVRSVCPHCAAVHYENPKVVVGCLVERGEFLLMCRRAIEPRRGFWTLPAGFLELQESTMQGAMRETWEEAQAAVRVRAPFCHLDVPHIGQSYVLFRAEFEALGFAPGPESLEVELMALDELPWSELAFPVIRVALELYCADRRAGSMHVHHGVVHHQPGSPAYAAGHSDLREHLRVPLMGGPVAEAAMEDAV